ncbi:MucR family transcriptional regulator [Novosphingobium rosa]|uniref:MucR family transcriptional regulator n=1 Tax=Novosphingobium rosa TaxID=76978 RepID=UPI00082E2A3A|nr:MucR family transcriptional regulator [Novosphingobium rosa]
MANETLLTLAADIVSAHVSNNTVSNDDLPRLIQSVYGSLQGLGQEAPVEHKPEPAVSVRASLKSDTLTCLDCGTKMKMLKRHLATDHGLSPAEYRARWGLNADYPMVAPDYAARRKELAVKIGLGRKPAGDDAAAKKPRAVAKDGAAPAKRGPRKKAESEASAA